MAKAARKKLHPAMQYADDVVAGRVVTGRLVRLAVERHLRDLKRKRNFPYYFDEAAALHAIDWFRFLKHSKGEWAGQTITLEPWQLFIQWTVYGWKHSSNHMRRFRLAYKEVGRKNGKSTFGAGNGTYLAFADGEAGAEVYSGATKLDQAKIVHEEATRMVKASEALRGWINIFKNNLNCPETNSKFEPLGADAETFDGFNVHGAIVDEYHAHKTRELFDVIDTATGARRQPLIWIITTAGAGRQGPCWEMREYVRKVLEQIIADETIFGYIATIDEKDDWTDPACWPKANPNLGVSVKMEDLQRKVNLAMQMPSKQNDVRRKHLNEWVSQVTRAIRMDLWDKITAPVDEEALAGQPCLAALDMSKSEDITAWTLLFPDEEKGIDGGADVLVRLWIPEETAAERERDNGIPYSAWEREGLIQFTDGQRIDYETIRAQVLADSHRFQIEQIAYDPWNAQQFARELEHREGANMIEFPQTIKHFNEGTKKLLELVVAGLLRHGGHQVLRWMADNLEVRTDPSGNIRPVKPQHGSPLKIDGIVAVIMTVALAIKRQEGLWNGEIVTL